MPWIAATTGLGELSIASWTSNRLAPFGALPNSLMSAPAMKVLAVADEDDGLDAGIRDGLAHAVREPIAHGSGKGIHGRRIERQNGDVAVP